MAKILYGALVHLDLLDIKMKKKSIAELGHNDLLPVYEPYFA